MKYKSAISKDNLALIIIWYQANEKKKKEQTWILRTWICHTVWSDLGIWIDKYDWFILKQLWNVITYYHIIMRRFLKEIFKKLNQVQRKFKKMQACTKIKSTYDQNKPFKIIKKEAFYQQGDCTATYV